MFFDILTLFPGMFEGAFSDSIILRAQERGLISIAVRNIRDYSDDTRHKTVDDYPYGGDAGMLLKPQPLAAAIKDAVRDQGSAAAKGYFSDAAGGAPQSGSR